MLETFKTFIQTLPPEYLLGTFFGTLVAFGIFIHFIKQQIQEESRYIASNILNNEASINSYASDLEKKVKPDTYFYKEYLHSTLDFVEKHLGKLKLFSYKTWEKHFTYSLIYSVFFFYLIWLFGGSGTIGTLNFFPNENRLIVSLFLIFEIITLYFTLYKTEQVINFLSSYIPLFSQLSNTWKGILVVGVGVVVGVVVVVVVVAVVVVVILTYCTVVQSAHRSELTQARPDRDVRGEPARLRGQHPPESPRHLLGGAVQGTPLRAALRAGHLRQPAQDEGRHHGGK